jgi:pimeloyl-ACP methyl ester carboxylesterase
MRSIVRPATPDVPAPIRIVCLPGAYDTAERFVAAGFDAVVRARRLPIDLVFVDPELKHLADRSVREELRREHILPARTEGCRSLWLAGISLGGFIALDYAAAHPGDLDGVCLLAPYLGNRMVTREMAGGPAPAGSAMGALAESEEERRIWRFIRDRPGGTPPLHLGYGRQDRFAPAHGLMARSLPPDAVDVAPGGHVWETWTRLWENFLASRFT